MNLRKRSMLLALLCFTASFSYAQKKRPNIILILADDMGFSDVGCYGGDVQTTNINKLASEGLRYKQFYNAARCCPTRASLITGLYPHQAGMGWMAAADLGTPEYQDNLNNTSVTIAEVLKSAGYSTFMSGKWHLTNERKIDGEVTDNWPKQRGFDRYFGIIPGGANYFTPFIYSNNKRYKAPENFYLTNAITDTSVKFIAEHEAKQKDKPFFLYLAYTSPHWPLHALQKDIDKYKDAYTKGWDKVRAERFERQKALGLFPKNAVISPRDPEVPAWDSEPENVKKEMAMRMAIYAAQIDIMDQGIGRVVAELKKTGQLDNTLIFFLSDNGACAEYISSGETKEVNGKADSFESYRINWANASSTPFKEYKHFTYEGGIATPLIIHWPNGVSKNLNNSFVNNYGHIMDIMATCVDVSGAKYPTTFKGNTITPMQGKSLAANFKGQSINRGEVYWEHEANIALRDGKWKLVAKTPQDQKFDKSTLELFDMEADPTEMNNLAKQYPDRVNEMYSRWEAWGKKIHVFPMDTREYNVRMREYKRTVNGEFNDNLGGWKVKKGNDVSGDIAIDESSVISGKKSALVTMSKPGTKPAGLVMNWDFQAMPGEKFKVQLKTKSNKPTQFFVRLEKAGGDFKKVIDQSVKTATTVSAQSYQSDAITEKGNYKLALYFGGLNAGDKVWVDDVKLIPVK